MKLYEKMFAHILFQSISVYKIWQKESSFIIYRISLRYQLQRNLVRNVVARNSWWHEKKLTFKSIDIIFSGGNGCEFLFTYDNWWH